MLHHASPPVKVKGHRRVLRFLAVMVWRLRFALRAFRYAHKFELARQSAGLMRRTAEQNKQTVDAAFYLGMERAFEVALQILGDKR